MYLKRSDRTDRIPFSDRTRSLMFFLPPAPQPFTLQPRRPFSPTTNFFVFCLPALKRYTFIASVQKPCRRAPPAAFVNVAAECRTLLDQIAGLTVPGWIWPGQWAMNPDCKHCRKHVHLANGINCPAPLTVQSIASFIRQTCFSSSAIV